MTCDYPNNPIDRYLDDELSAPERARFEQHLADCLGCAARIERGQRIQAMFESAPVLAMPDDFAAAILAKARQRQAQPISLRIGAILWQAAAVLFIALTVTLAYQGTQGENQSKPHKHFAKKGPESLAAFSFDSFGNHPQGSLANSYLDLQDDSAKGGR